MVSGPDREYSLSCSKKVNPAVIWSVRQKRSGLGLVEHLPEVLVLRRNGGEVWGLQAMGVPEQAPAYDGTSRPVNEGIVSLEPGESQYHGNLRRLDELELDMLAESLAHVG